MYPKVSNKTIKKQRFLKSPSFQRCRTTQKERSLILVAKGLQESVLYQFTRRKLGRPARCFFLQRTEPNRVREDNFLNCISYQPVLRMHLKKCWTHGRPLLITLFIWTLFDFWVSGHALNVGKLRKKVEDKCFCVS